MNRRYQMGIAIGLILLISLACTISLGAPEAQVQAPVQAPVLSQQDMITTSVAQTLASNPVQPVTVATTQAPPPPAGPPTNTPKPCNKAAFISETVPDGTSFLLNKSFTKSWRFRNDGTCTWNTSYQLVFNGGDQLSGPSTKNFPTNVQPGEQVDLSVSLKSPGTSGTYTGYWKMRSDTGLDFPNNFSVNIKASNVMIVYPVISSLIVLPAFQVTSVSFAVDTPVFTGACPHTFHFTAGITVNTAGTVTYRWTRSDGALAPLQSLVFAGSGTKYVTTTWSLGAVGTRWQKIYIDNPNHQTFGTATFTLNCT